MECAYDYVRLRRTRAVWTALTLLTADIVDEVDRIAVCGQRCQFGPLSIPSIWSITSMPSNKRSRQAAWQEPLIKLRLL